LHQTNPAWKAVEILPNEFTVSLKERISLPKSFMMENYYFLFGSIAVDERKKKIGMANGIPISLLSSSHPSRANIHVII